MRGGVRRAHLDVTSNRKLAKDTGVLKLVNTRFGRARHSLNKLRNALPTPTHHAQGELHSALFILFGPIPQYLAHPLLHGSRFQCVLAGRRGTQPADVQRESAVGRRRELGDARARVGG